ncbi:hypothetical protein ACFY3M_43120 [Streptomyces mirabilis]|uniref:hypothetical protein n=1 Tax=Streptomyces mirabilis TaxID=68239 RepID=UPI0036893AB1
MRHPFELDEDAAKELAGRVAPLLPDADAAEEKRWRSLDPVTEFLVDRYGRWACGWNWSVGEGDTDGGVFGAVLRRRFRDDGGRNRPARRRGARRVDRVEARQ